LKELGWAKIPVETLPELNFQLQPPIFSPLLRLHFNHLPSAKGFQLLSERL
jgi:hypothetical protein